MTCQKHHKQTFDVVFAFTFSREHKRAALHCENRVRLPCCYTQDQGRPLNCKIRKSLCGIDEKGAVVVKFSSCHAVYTHKNFLLCSIYLTVFRETRKSGVTDKLIESAIKCNFDVNGWVFATNQKRGTYLLIIS